MRQADIMLILSMVIDEDFIQMIGERAFVLPILFETVMKSVEDVL